MADSLSVLPLYLFCIAFISGCITAIILELSCCFMVIGSIIIFIIIVNIIIAKPIFCIPNLNIKFKITPSISATQPIIGVFILVKNKSSKDVPPKN